MAAMQGGLETTHGWCYEGRGAVCTSPRLMAAKVEGGVAAGRVRPLLASQCYANKPEVDLNPSC